MDVQVAARAGILGQSEGGTVVALLRHLEQRQEYAPVIDNAAICYFKELNFNYKRYRCGLKKNATSRLSNARAG